MGLWTGSALTAPWWISRINQLLLKIDGLIETSHYDPDGQLAPYELWPSHKDKDLKDWLADREVTREDRKPKPENPYG